MGRVRAGVEEEELRLAEEVVAWKSNLVFTTNNQIFSFLGLVDAIYSPSVL